MGGSACMFWKVGFFLFLQACLLLHFPLYNRPTFKYLVLLCLFLLIFLLVSLKCSQELFMLAKLQFLMNHLTLFNYVPLILFISFGYIRGDFGEKHYYLCY